MFRTGGAAIRLAGFHRKAPLAEVEGIVPCDLGRTEDGRFVQRVLKAAGTAIRPQAIAAVAADADVIVARNLEMLGLAIRARHAGGRRDVPIVYESLDIHRLLLGGGAPSRALRWFEGRLARSADALMTSSPAFVEHYFAPLSAVRLPTLLVENKVFLGGIDVAPRPRPVPRPDGPWRIGWFGAIRCLKSFRMLAALTRALEGRIEVVIRGRPAASEFPGFEAMVAAEPHIRFAGSYRNPEELPAIYGEVDFAWAIDFFEEGQNSEWLLPNRLYESGWAGAVPIALARTATGAWLARRGVGVRLDAPVEAALTHFFRGLDAAGYAALERGIGGIEPSAWLCGADECRDLVRRLATPAADSAVASPGHRH